MKKGVYLISDVSNGKKYVHETIKGVKISTFYQLTRQQYLDVLAHEMIHVCISQKGIKVNMIPFFIEKLIVSFHIYPVSVTNRTS